MDLRIRAEPAEGMMPDAKNSAEADAEENAEKARKQKRGNLFGGHTG